MASSNTSRVWEVDLNTLREKLFDLFLAGAASREQESLAQRATIDGLKRALDAKQHVEVSLSLFSIFKRKSS